MEEEQRGMYVHPLALAGMVAVLAVMLTILVMNNPGGLSASSGTHQGGQAATVASARPGLQLYQSTMHPWIVQDHPGTCPICGMELVKMQPDAQAEYLANHPEFPT